MPIFTIIVVLVAIGVLLWAVNTYVPMEAHIKKIVNIVAITLVIFWLLNIFGIFSILQQARV